MWKMVEIPFPTTMVSGEPTHLSSLLQGVTERLGFLQAGRMGKDGKMLPWTQYDIMDLENVQETMTLCLQINVVFLKIFLQTKSGNAAFISSIVYNRRPAVRIWENQTSVFNASPGYICFHMLLSCVNSHIEFKK